MEAWLDWGYPGLFAISFLAATVIPLASEPFFLLYIGMGGDPVLAVAVASAGNTAGGLTSYGLGFLGHNVLLNRWFATPSRRLERGRKWVENYGSVFAGLCWLPIVGDAIAIALGLNKNHWLPVSFWMALGKTARYAVLVWLI